MKVLRIIAAFLIFVTASWVLAACGGKGSAETEKKPDTSFNFESIADKESETETEREAETEKSPDVEKEEDDKDEKDGKDAEDGDDNKNGIEMAAARVSRRK